MGLGEVEKHPYGIFIPKSGARRMIIGTFPIGKFTDKARKDEIQDHEINFYYGGERNHLWKILSQVYNRELNTKNKIKEFLEEEQIAMADVIESCQRVDGRADDSKLKNIKWNTELSESIIKNKITKLLLTSKQVEKWFHQNIGSIPGVKEIVLVSPSGSGLRSIGRNKSFQEWSKKNPKKTATDFRLETYKTDFLNS